MKYLKDCNCIEELRKLYSELCFKYHPDISKEENATEIMKEINAEYEVMQKHLKNVHKKANEDKGQYKSEDKQSYSKVPEELKEVIEKVQTLEGCTIEIIGSWLWIRGNTYQHRKFLSDLKFNYHRTKKAWYFSKEKSKKKTKKNFSLDEIRDIYGSQEVHKKSHIKIEKVAS